MPFNAIGLSESFLRKAFTVLLNSQFCSMRCRMDYKYFNASKALGLIHSPSPTPSPAPLPYLSLHHGLLLVADY